MNRARLISVEQDKRLVTMQCTQCLLYACCHWGYPNRWEQTQEQAEESCAKSRCRCELAGDVTDLDIGIRVRGLGSSEAVGTVEAIDMSVSPPLIRLAGDDGWRPASGYRPEWA